MSSRHLLVLTALTSLFVVQAGARPGAAQTPEADSLADLLIQDRIAALEARLVDGPRTAETVAFRGEVAYRKGRFEEAESLYRTALQMDAKTARAHFGLGKLAIAKLKAEEAAKSFLQAIALDPREAIYRFYVSDALALQKKWAEAEQQLREYVRLASNDPDRLAMADAALDIYEAFRGVEVGAVEAPPRPAPIRFQQMLNLLFAEVSINGQGPYRFLVDTGATQTVLSEKLAIDLGLKQIATNVMHGVGGEGKKDSGVYRVDALSIGDVTIRNLPLGTLDNPLLDQFMDGIVGTSMLSDFIITIDYPQSRMELSRESEESGTVVPIWCFSGLLLVPVEVNGRHRGNFLIDSGADSTILSHAMAGNLGINKDTPGAKLNLPIGGIGGLDDGVLLVPSVTLKSPFAARDFDVLMSIELQGMSKLIQTELSGVLGYDTLKDYRLTIDYRKAEVRLNR